MYLQCIWIHESGYSLYYIYMYCIWNATTSCVSTNGAHVAIDCSTRIVGVIVRVGVRVVSAGGE